jgi:hypothetical protein
MKRRVALCIQELGLEQEGQPRIPLQILSWHWEPDCTHPQLYCILSSTTNLVIIGNGLIDDIEK